METKTTKGDGPKFYEGDLHNLLVEKLPSRFIDPSSGRLNTKTLSEETGFARFSVYQWLHGRRLTRRSAQELLRISSEAAEEDKRGALTREDLLPFFGI